MAVSLDTYQRAATPPPFSDDESDLSSTHSVTERGMGIEHHGREVTQVEQNNRIVKIASTAILILGMLLLAAGFATVVLGSFPISLSLFGIAGACLLIGIAVHSILWRNIALI